MKINAKTVLLQFIFAATIYTAARFELLVGLTEVRDVNVVWIPSGLGFIAAVILGWRAVPAILLGCFAALSTHGVPVLPAVGIAISYSLAPIAGAWAIRYDFITQPTPGPLRLMKILLSAGLTCLITAAAGSLVFAAAGLIIWPDLLNSLYTWWVGDFVGITLFIPMVLARDIRGHTLERLKPLNRLFLLLYYIAVVGLGTLMIGGNIPHGWLDALPYIYLVLLGISSTRYRYLQIAPSIMLASGAAIAAVMQGSIQFTLQHKPANLLVAIAYMIVLNLIGLIMADATHNREKTEENLRHNAMLLEDRVRERTADLATANASLQEEVASHASARDALRKSEEKYRHVVDGQAEMLANFKTDGTLLFVNKAFCDYFKVNREDVLGGVLPHISEATREDFLTNLRDHSGIERVFSVEHQHTGMDNRVHLLHWTTSTILDESGNTTEFLAVGRDVTKARALEQALEESRIRYKSLFDDSPISLKEEDFSQVKVQLDEVRRQGVTDIRAYIVEHPDFITTCAALVRTVDVNNAAVRMYAAEHKNQLLSSLEPIFGPATESGFGLQILNLFNGILMYDFETVNYKLNGDRIDLLVRWSVAPGCEETLSRVFISAIDITERIRSAHNLAESQNMLRLVMDSIPMAIYWKDLNSVYRGGNRVQAAWAGLDDPGAIVGKTDFELPWAEQAEVFIESDRRVIRTGVTESHTLEKHIRENMKEYWVDNTKSPLRNPDGEIIGVLGSYEDISDRIHAEEERLASEQKFRTLFEQSYDGITLTRPNGIITDWNRRMEEITGLPSEKILGKYLWDVHHIIVLDPAQRDMVANMARQEFRMLEATGRLPSEKMSIEMNFLRPDGDIRRVVAVNFCIEFGREKVVATLTRDITSEKQYQQAALESQKLAELGTLSAGIAHEINTPLQIINGLSERMMGRVSSGKYDTERLARDLANINSNGWRVANIVRSLLTYARATSGDFERNSLNLIISDTLLLIEHQLKSWSSIIVVTDLQPDLPDILCDHNKISQLVINLLNNARDAMPQGGEIAILTRTIMEGYVTLKVSDQGVGIPTKIQNRIFDPFFTTKGVSFGTGLGLSIVMGVVKAHGGTIQLDSAEGKGTTFIITLPLDPPAGLHKPVVESFDRYAKH